MELRLGLTYVNSRRSRTCLAIGLGLVLSGTGDGATTIRPSASLLGRGALRAVLGAGLGLGADLGRSGPATQYAPAPRISDFNVHSLSTQNGLELFGIWYIFGIRYWVFGAGTARFKFALAHSSFPSPWCVACCVARGFETRRRFETRQDTERNEARSWVHGRTGTRGTEHEEARSGLGARSARLDSMHWRSGASNIGLQRAFIL
ncbi:hypothetical protein FB451DRAFT_685836 [Mycena latifolia]|nr:hypothetical protein FB451DRAFT_685836 [Mycena latifolia]